MAKINLQQYGLRKTYPRVKVLEILEDSEDAHLSAEEIYSSLLKKRENIALSSIYRVLTDLEEGGLLVRHQFQRAPHAKYEIKSKIPHDHIICIQCGKILEFIDRDLLHKQASIADKYGFVLDEHSLTLYGHCKNSDCQRSH